MPDIAMCKGSGCPMRRRCYRFTAKPSKYLQTYFKAAPYTDTVSADRLTRVVECEYYWSDECW